MGRKVVSPSPWREAKAARPLTDDGRERGPATSLPASDLSLSLDLSEPNTDLVHACIDEGKRSSQRHARSIAKSVLDGSRTPCRRLPAGLYPVAGLTWRPHGGEVRDEGPAGARAKANLLVPSAPSELGSAAASLVTRPHRSYARWPTPPERSVGKASAAARMLGMGTPRQIDGGWSLNDPAYTIACLPLSRLLWSLLAQGARRKASVAPV
ncbi:uncharacterized protein PSFLO_05860 [Pseudozyma flocculosa]|uniref:Uncharacterized protein n=1 Tax=Pseudozyma flocculosa TaxID=84751 RepID=A0A5C3F7D3_9BASI|nr:uncharacterized protein PSFLO_05860 [Pseudozyma flocculosa]